MVLTLCYSVNTNMDDTPHIVTVPELDEIEQKLNVMAHARLLVPIYDPFYERGSTFPLFCF